MYIRNSVSNTYSTKASVINNPEDGTLYFNRNLIVDNSAPLQWDSDVDQVFWDIPSSDGNFTLRIWTDYVEDETGTKIPRKFVEDIFGNSTTHGEYWKVSEKLILQSYYHDHIDIMCNIVDEDNKVLENITQVSIPDN